MKEKLNMGWSVIFLVFRYVNKLITKLVNKHAGMEMAQLICGGCQTLLIYTRGAASIRCSCCHTINVAPGTI